jgi:hypothetical protein
MCSDDSSSPSLPFPRGQKGGTDDDGLVTRVESFLIHQESEALDAAGLSE